MSWEVQINQGGLHVQIARTLQDCKILQMITPDCEIVAPSRKKVALGSGTCALISARSALAEVVQN